MLRDRRIAVLLAALLVAAVIAACSDDDPAGPGSGCADLIFDDILPTDETGEIIGTGGEGDWCWPSGGADPSRPYLYPAFPNPFNPSTTIQFVLPDPAHVRLRVVDDRCRTIRVLLDDARDFGTWQVVWNGADEDGARRSDGLYGVVLEVGDFKCSGAVELRSVP